MTQKKGELLSLIQSEFDTTILKGHGYCLCALFLTLPATIRFLHKEKPTAIISGLPFLNIMATLALRFTKQPCNLIAVEHMRLSPKGPLLHRIKQTVKQTLIKWVHKHATHTVCVSQTVCADVSQYAGSPQKPIRLIYNPIIPDEIGSLIAEPISHRWVHQKEASLILAIGRLLPVKNFETLLRAFKEVIKERPTKLILLGEGVELLKLERLIEKLGIQDHVSMPGTVRNVFPYLKAADLFVLSSLHEAFGNVVAESLACGTPVVSTDSGGPREILKDGELGTLVPCKNPTALKDAILKTLDTQHNSQKLIERSKDFSAQKAAEAYLKLIG